MPNLKDLKLRIGSVKATQKITSAMKMVAAAKLRRAQEQAEAARPYAERMERMLTSLAQSLATTEGTSPLLGGTGKDHTHLVILVTSDRGLCGGFNSSVVRDTRRFVQGLLDGGKTVKLLCVGRKARDQIKRDYGSLIVGALEGVGAKRLAFAEAESIALRVVGMLEAGEFDTCTIIYNRFQSVISQVVTRQQLVPLPLAKKQADSEAEGGARAIYEYEPNEEDILTDLLPRNLAVQIFRALLESAAGEQGARMSAMDNATRNAGDMIEKLTLFYNRTRQAAITKELIEIVSGAEAL